jgi:CHRD domain
VHELGDITMAHIHIGMTGENGPVVVWLYPRDGKPALIKGVKDGELAKGEITEASLEGPEKGKPLSALVKAMRDGDAYVNLHTAEHKDGEIRGQIASSR